MSDETTTYIDATGLTCPMPLMLLKKAIDGLPGGALVKIEVTDVHAELDFEIWCERFGHTFVKVDDTKDVLKFQVVTGNGLVAE